MTCLTPIAYAYVDSYEYTPMHTCLPSYSSLSVHMPILIVFYVYLDSYRIAGYLRGGKFSRISRINLYSRIFSPSKYIDVWLFISSLLIMRENFTLEMSPHRAFAKIFPLENNPLYGMPYAGLLYSFIVYI